MLLHFLRVERMKRGSRDLPNLAQFVLVTQELLEQRRGAGVRREQPQGLPPCLVVWRLADDLSCYRIGFRMHVVTEELQRFLRWQQRFFRVTQAFEKLLFG